MNLLLFDSSEILENARVKVTGRRAKHLEDVLRAKIGDSLRVGQIGGMMGEAKILSLEAGSAVLEYSLTQTPPPKIPLILYLALPRPKFLNRCLQTATTLGVQKIVLMNAYKVEKVYWSCEQISPESVRESCLLGLEQARDTILPEVIERRLFKPFVEDELPHLIKGTTAFVAHPDSTDSCPYRHPGPLSLAIGPEGGFIDYEIGKLQAAGFTSVGLTKRILKVETAITALISRLA